MRQSIMSAQACPSGQVKSPHSQDVHASVSYHLSGHLDPSIHQSALFTPPGATWAEELEQTTH